MARNYVMCCEALKLAARAWDSLGGREVVDKQEALALFADLQSVDRNFHDYNVCKLLFQKGDGAFASFGDRRFGPTQFIVAQGYRFGRGVAPDLDLAKRHYALGARLGNIPCALALYGLLPARAKLANIFRMLSCSIRFTYINSNWHDDTRIMY
ncbi:hypothetical protein [Pleomorphomonas sp. PLEO]|uniref:hypothetical protein n=1 Tax=Pleomorphomonas sp. PLEO TaxID=3239306 RepID=UPI00351E7730